MATFNHSEKINEVLNTLKNKGVKYEVAKGKYGQDMIGMVLYNSQWTWFWISEYNSNFELYFDHTYSQIVGRVKKGWSHQLKKVAAAKKVLPNVTIF